MSDNLELKKLVLDANNITFAIMPIGSTSVKNSITETEYIANELAKIGIFVMYPTIEKFNLNNLSNIYILPYPTTFVFELSRLRCSKVQRTGMLNMDFGNGIVKNLHTLKLTWDFMDFDAFRQLQKCTLDNEFWVYYFDNSTKSMRANLFYIDDGGIATGGVLAQYDENDVLVSGYTAVSCDMIMSLNDDKQVVDANDICYSSGGDKL